MNIRFAISSTILSSPTRATFFGASGDGNSSWSWLVSFPGGDCSDDCWSLCFKIWK